MIIRLACAYPKWSLLLDLSHELGESTVEDVVDRFYQYLRIPEANRKSYVVSVVSFASAPVQIGPKELQLRASGVFLDKCTVVVGANASTLPVAFSVKDLACSFEPQGKKPCWMTAPLQPLQKDSKRAQDGWCTVDIFAAANTSEVVREEEETAYRLRRLVDSGSASCAALWAQRYRQFQYRGVWEDPGSDPEGPPSSAYEFCFHAWIRRSSAAAASVSSYSTTITTSSGEGGGGEGSAAVLAPINVVPPVGAAAGKGAATVSVEAGHKKAVAGFCYWTLKHDQRFLAHSGKSGVEFIRGHYGERAQAVEFYGLCADEGSRDWLAEGHYKFQTNPGGSFTGFSKDSNYRRLSQPESLEDEAKFWVEIMGGKVLPCLKWKAFQASPPYLPSLPSPLSTPSPLSSVVSPSPPSRWRLGCCGEWKGGNDWNFAFKFCIESPEDLLAAAAAAGGHSEEDGEGGGVGCVELEGWFEWVLTSQDGEETDGVSSVEGKEDDAEDAVAAPPKQQVLRQFGVALPGGIQPGDLCVLRLRGMYHKGSRALHFTTSESTNKSISSGDEYWFAFSQDGECLCGFMRGPYPWPAIPLNARLCKAQAEDEGSSSAATQTGLATATGSGKWS